MKEFYIIKIDDCFISSYDGRREFFVSTAYGNAKEFKTFEEANGVLTKYLSVNNEESCEARIIKVSFEEVLFIEQF